MPFPRLAVLVTTLLAAPLAAAPPAGKVYDENTDYTKLTQDELIAALDADKWGTNDNALAEVLRRGPDVLKAAMPVVRDWQYARINDERMIAVLLVNRDTLDRSARVLPAFRVAAKPGPVMIPGLPTGASESRPLMKAADPYLSPPLLKALRSEDAAERAAAVAIVGEARFTGMASLVAEVGKLAAAPGERRMEYLDLLAKAGTGATPVYAVYLAGDDADLRAIAVRALTPADGPPRIGRRDPGSAAALRPLLTHKDDLIRRTAAQAAFLLGDVEAALPVLLKLSWPTRPDPKGGGDSPWPVYPREVQGQLRFLNPADTAQALPALKEAILSGEVPREANGVHALMQMGPNGLPLWRELTESKVDRVRTLARGMVQTLGPKEGPKPFREVAADEQKKRFHAWLEKPYLFTPGSPSLDDVPRQMILDNLPAIEEKLNKPTTDKVSGNGQLVRLLLRGGPEGHAVVVRLLESGDRSRAAPALDALEVAGVAAYPDLVPAVRKCLTADSLYVRVTAAMVLARDPPSADGVARAFRECLALADNPRKLAEALGEDPKYADETAAAVRPIAHLAVARVDAAGRKGHLAELVKLLREATGPDPKVRADDVIDGLIDLGPLARDAAPDLVKLLTDTTDPAARATVARVLRAVDVEAARRAGVR